MSQYVLIQITEVTKYIILKQVSIRINMLQQEIKFLKTLIIELFKDSVVNYPSPFSYIRIFYISQFSISHVFLFWQLRKNSHKLIIFQTHVYHFFFSNINIRIFISKLTSNFSYQVCFLSISLKTE